MYNNRLLSDMPPSPISLIWGPHKSKVKLIYLSDLYDYAHIDHKYRERIIGNIWGCRNYYQIPILYWSGMYKIILSQCMLFSFITACR